MPKAINLSKISVVLHGVEYVGDEAIRALYLDEKSSTQIARRLSLSTTFVGDKIKAMGISRSKNEAIRISSRNSPSRAAHNRADLTGETFGRLTVIEFYGVSKHQHSTWKCKCACGATRIIEAGSLRSGNSQSCGCLKKETTGERGRTHGMTETPIYRVWQAMMNRCRNRNQPAWRNYGGRGISVCERWHSFDNFLEDMGPRPSGRSIDRIDNSKGYFKENCRWATRAQQARNTRRNRFITFENRTATLKEWADEIGIDQSSLQERLEKWPLCRALTQQPKGAVKNG